MKVPPLIKKAQRWFFSTPDRALDRAYRAALAIKALEDEYFAGGMVCPESSTYSEAVVSYCRSEVRKNLGVIKSSLAEFKTTQTILSFSDLERATTDKIYDVEFRERSGIVIEKINFIDSVVRKYKVTRPSREKIAVSLVEIPQTPPSSQRPLIPSEPRTPALIEPMDKPKNRKQKVETISDKAGVLPRSLLKTFSRIQQEIDPQSQESEEEMLRKFRQSRDRTAVSIRFLLILVIVPLLVHQITKTFVIQPLVEQNFFQESNSTIFLNEDMQREAVEELKAFEESLHFRSLLGIPPVLSAEEMEVEVKHKAEELATDYRGRGSTAIANVFADVCSLIAFTFVIFASRKEIAMLKSFIDEIIYGLSDSAKSFLIILFTDIFVGFHSPHGWEVVLEGVAHHFGLPESRDFNFLFIATFPVILDTILKYWIFRYLNRISPSAVATYKTMNE